MGRKITVFVCMLALIFAYGMTAQAATHTIYQDGSIGTTYITYFKDILAGESFSSNYVAFRSGQYEYTMVVGELKYENNTITLIGQGTQYRFYNSGSNYNSYYKFASNDITAFSLNVDDNIIYCDLGKFPQLIERGAKYEMLSAVLLTIGLLGVVINRIFRRR